MIKTIARMFLLVAIAMILAHYLPAFYDLLAAQRFRAPSFQYSQVERAIIATRQTPDGPEYVNLTTGQTYTREQYQAILPLNNHAILMRQQRMPTEIDGVQLTRSAILLNRSDLRLTPRDFQEQIVALRPLLEAEDIELNLVMPADFVRIGDGFQFLNAASNAVDRQRTEAFQGALTAAGFRFPVLAFANNPTTRKGFDDGMLLVDDQGHWFRIRREFDQPVVQQLEIDLQPRLIQLREQANREIRGMVVTTDYRIHLLIGESFRTVAVPLRHFDPATTRLSLRGNLLDLQFIAHHETWIEYVVLNRDFEEIAYHSEPLLARNERPGQTLKQFLFPVTLAFKVPYQNFIGATFSFGNPWALLPGFLMATALLLLRRRCRWARHFDAPAIVVIVAFGWLGAVAALSVPQLKSS